MRTNPYISHSRQRGVALVLVLAAIVILTLVLVAFISKSQLDSNASVSFSAGVSANLLASDAANTIVAGLRSEMSANSTVTQTSGVSLYFPLSGTTGILPSLDSDATANAAAGIPNLLMSSRSTTGSFTGDPASLTSSVSAATPSLNGRYLPASRWNDPRLLTSAQNTQSLSGTNSSPNWIYVNRNGPVQLTSWSGSLATQQQNGTSNPAFVIGRFAYRVYDISGLLDMNAAGYPAGEQSDPRIGRKGTEAMADFFDLSGSDAQTLGFSPGSAGGGPDILSWRGPATSSYVTGSSVWISGTSPLDIYVNEFAQKYGFMIAPPQSYTNADTGNAMTFGAVNRLLDRSDLITLCNSGSFAAEFTDASDNQALFLSQATAFSREVNAPSWGLDSQPVSSPTTLNPWLGSTTSGSQSIASVTVSGTFTRRDGTTAIPGSSLMNERFPLSKIALLSTPSPQNPTANAAEILQYFGLKYVPAGSSGGGSDAYGNSFGPRSFDHWEYVHGTVQMTNASDGGLGYGTPGERMHTLQELASLNREPDFFELLQAGIQSDSLGQGELDCRNTAVLNYFLPAWKDQNLARHILQIGANIIGQYMTTQDPVVIARQDIGSLVITKPDPDISSVENAPYIQLLGRTYIRRLDMPVVVSDSNSSTSQVTTYPHLTSFYQFQLWNPHQNASQMATSGSFRIVANGTVQLTGSNIDGKGSKQYTQGTANTFTSTGATPDALYFSSTSNGSSNFSTPFTLQSDSPGVSITNSSTFSGVYTSGSAKVIGFCQGDLNIPYTGFLSTASGTTTATAQTGGARSYYERFGTLTTSSVTPPAPFWKPAELNTTTGIGFTGRIFTNVSSTNGLTFQLQKFSRNQQWVPLQTIPAITVIAEATNYSNFNSDQVSTLYATNSNVDRDGDPTSELAGDSISVSQAPVWIDTYCVFTDPRTSRFGFFYESNASQGNLIDAIPSGTTTVQSQGWLPSNDGAPAASSSVVSFPAFQIYANQPGSLAYYTDRGKAVTRLGDFPSSSPYSNVQSRPIVLNRPFLSVAEMGYAFRDLPWKSLNFSSDDSSGSANSPKPTADAGLLDLFSLTESPVRAGTINLNTASHQALTALLLGTSLNPTVSGTTQGPASDTLTQISASDAGSVASDIRSYLGNRSAPGHVIRTAADIATMIQALPTAASWSKFKREAIVAALADVHNARTWNVLIDVVGQTGRFPSSAGNLAGFQVMGQKHLIMEVAIDRYTGQIVDTLVEQPSDESLQQ